MAIDHKKKQQDAKDFAVSLLSNPSFNLAGVTPSDMEKVSTLTAKFCHQLAFKLQDES